MRLKFFAVYEPIISNTSQRYREKMVVLCRAGLVHFGLEKAVVGLRSIHFVCKHKIIMRSHYCSAKAIKMKALFVQVLPYYGMIQKVKKISNKFYYH